MENVTIKLTKHGGQHLLHNLAFWMKITQTVVSLLVEQELFNLQENLSSPPVFSGFALIDVYFYVHVL